MEFVARFQGFDSNLRERGGLLRDALGLRRQFSTVVPRGVDVTHFRISQGVVKAPLPYTLCPIPSALCPTSLRLGAMSNS